jgi:excinuclease UvrABC nuclease subunit
VSFLDLAAQKALHEWRLVLWPLRWQGYSVTGSLTWVSTEFNDNSVSAVPNVPGVYAFLLHPGVPPGLNVSYVMYVGRTGRSLRIRFREYLRESSDPAGRPRILRLLQPYAGFLHFCCATVESPLTPNEVEEQLLSSLLPPVNEQLPAEVSRVMRAF